MDIELLASTLRERGEPAYRARQVWEWAARGASGYDAMTNVPAPLREALRESVPFSTLTVGDEQQAKDGTVKTLFRTHDGHPVEAVLMRYRDGRRSICVSSQSGCPLTCTFCATGAMQFGRNLTTSEILDQALHFRRLEESDRGSGAASPLTHGRAPKPRDTIHPSHGGGASPLTNCVFMGMGEPLMNFENVLAAARRLPEVGVTPRRTTISTVGWLPGLTRFIDEVDEPIRIALSLHAANPALRSQLMPVNDRYPLADVLDELHRYHELRHRKVYIEYVMLEGVNDTPRHAAELAAILDEKTFKVNLIPYNPTGMYGGSSRDAIAAFKARARSGADPGHGAAHARSGHRRACGQLAAAQAADDPPRRPNASQRLRGPCLESDPGMPGSVTYERLASTESLSSGDALTVSRRAASYLTTGSFAALTSSSLRTGRERGASLQQLRGLGRLAGDRASSPRRNVEPLLRLGLRRLDHQRLRARRAGSRSSADGRRSPSAASRCRAR